MISKKIKKILSFNGIAIIVGILGSISSILTIAVQEWDSVISLKWFVFSLFVSISFIVILIKLLIDLNIEIKSKSLNSTINVIRFLPDKKIFLIRKNDLIGFYAMVSIFFLDEECEIEFGKGYALNIQENLIQIQIVEISNEFTRDYNDLLIKINNNDLNVLNKIIVKNYVTYSNN